MASLFSHILIASILVFFAAGAKAQMKPLPTEEQLRASGLLPLPADEHRQLLANRTLYHIGGDGRRIAIYYRDDGIRFVKLGTNVRKTKWWLDGAKRCEVSVRTNRDQCHSLFRDGDALILCTVDERACDWEIEVVAGDPEKISQ